MRSRHPQVGGSAGEPSAVVIVSSNPALGSALQHLLEDRPDGLIASSVEFDELLSTPQVFSPDLLVRNRAQKRREAIRLELPVALDHMLISVQAGLGFEAAMGRAGTSGKGPMAEELIRTLQDIQVGRSRKDAYLAMAERVDVPDVRSFIRAVVQADAYGVAIAGVLKAQAGDMRIKRKQRAEEHAMKMPVKMLFPLIFFILPTLFIVVLGPTVMSIMSLFMG